jgi:hypothetical protein
MDKLDALVDLWRWTFATYVIYVVLDEIYALDVIYMCYVSSGCDICHIYVCLSLWKTKKIKHKSDRIAERGRRQRGLCESPWPLPLATLGTNFPSSGVPSFAERSC